MSDLLKKPLSRRSALKAALMLGGAATLAACNAKAPPTGTATDAPLQLDLTTIAFRALATVGGTAVTEANSIDKTGLLLYRVNETEVVAFSRKCTHNGCTISAFDQGISTCPCHQAQFNLSGEVMSGPAKNPLKQYPTRLSGNILEINHEN